MSGSLGKLTEEESNFQVKTDQASGQTIISGMGQIALEIIVSRLKRKFKVKVKIGRTQV